MDTSTLDGEAADGRPPPRWALRAAAAAVIAAASVALAAAPAHALSQRGHSFAGTISGSEACTLAEPAAVAVSEATGDLYVANRGTSNVVELGQAGECLGVFEGEVPSPEGIAVDNAAGSPGKGDVFVASGESVLEFGAKGKLLATKTKFKNPETGETEEFGELHGVAVDARGDLYVYRGEEGVVGFSGSQVISDTGALSSLKCTEVELPGLAVGPDGDPLYIEHLISNGGQECSEHPRSVIARLSPEGAPEDEALDSEQSSGLTVDLRGSEALGTSAGDVYVDNEKSIAEFDSAGGLVQRFGAGHLHAAQGLAVDSDTGTVYAAEPAAGKLAVFAPEAPGAPEVDSVGSSGLTATTAALEAEIDPHGADTHYYFQYGTVDCATSPAECTDVPAPPPGEDIGSGFGDRSERVEVGSLQPGTAYSFRVVATNEHGEAQASQTLHTFTTPPGPGEGLIDGRVWELVSPGEKHGASAEPIGGVGGASEPVQAAAGGGAIGWASDSPIEAEVEGNRSPEGNAVISTRDSGGWSSKDVMTPHEKGEGIASGNPEEYRLYSSELNQAILQPPTQTFEAIERPPLSPEASERTIYLRENGVVPCVITAPACYEPLVTGAEPFADVLPGTHFGTKLEFLDATPDLGHAVLESRGVQLTAATAPEGGLYEWGSERQLRFVSQLPDGTPASSAALGDSQAGGVTIARNAISADGSRVFWTGTSEKDGETVTHLYMRDTKSEKTIQIDAAQGVKEPTAAEAAHLEVVHYQGASADGTKVFFTDTYPLTPESTLEPLENGPADLYVCEFASAEAETCTLKDLTPDPRADLGENAEVAGMALGTSQDGTYAYFVANGVLAPELLARGARAGSCLAREGAEEGPGQCYLYVVHRGAGGWEAPRAIATLSQEDSPDWGSGLERLDRLTARVSPNGRYLAFMSEGSLTGYENEDAAGGGRDEEVFLYDAVEQRLTCASCNPSGARPHGVDDREGTAGGGLLVDRPAAWQEERSEEQGGKRRVLDHRLAASIPGWTALGDGTALTQARYLSDEGRLFFDAADSLVPADGNGEEDVYEYEPAGVGSCGAQAGCVALISSGQSDHESAFLDAGESGADAFFITSQALVPSDHDQSFDVYDARIGGESHSAAPSQECEAASTCRPLPPASVVFPAPAIAGPPGPGDRSNSHVLPFTSKSPTRAQLLAKSLASCRHRYRGRRATHRRTVCEREARRRYGPAPAHRARSRHGKAKSRP